MSDFKPLVIEKNDGAQSITLKSLSDSDLMEGDVTKVSGSSGRWPVSLTVSLTVLTESRRGPHIATRLDC